MGARRAPKGILSGAVLRPDDARDQLFDSGTDRQSAEHIADVMREQQKPGTGQENGGRPGDHGNRRRGAPRQGRRESAKMHRVA